MAELIMLIVKAARQVNGLSSSNVKLNACNFQLVQGFSTGSPQTTSGPEATKLRPADLFNNL